MKIEVFSDLVCPWCYLGKKRLERALEQVRGSATVIWRSFELDPSAPATFDGSIDELLARKYRIGRERAREMHAHMTALGAEEGLVYDFDRARPGNTFDAHRVVHLAEREGRAGVVVDRLMRGYFAEGAAIGDREELARLASEAGLDGEQVRGALAGDAFADAVRADEARARELGLDGVPAFVIDERRAIVGAQPAEVIARALAWAQRAS